MALNVHPKAGMIVMCDFAGYIVPVIVKVRPVVVISPNHISRPRLCMVVPLSTTPPLPIRPYHYKLAGSPFSHDPSEVWAKCDLVASVSIERLDSVPARIFWTRFCNSGGLSYGISLTGFEG